MDRDRNTCDGFGSCLRQVALIGSDYYRDTSVTCPWKCSIIPCANLRVCHEAVPLWLMWTNKTSGICKGCDTTLAVRLSFRETELPEVCAVCSKETRVLVTVPDACGHEMCCRCFAGPMRGIGGAEFDRISARLPKIFDKDTYASSESGADEEDAASGDDEDEAGVYTNMCPLCAVQTDGPTV